MSEHPNTIIYACGHICGSSAKGRSVEYECAECRLKAFNNVTDEREREPDAVLGAEDDTRVVAAQSGSASKGKAKQTSAASTQTDDPKTVADEKNLRRSKRESISKVSYRE